MGYHIYAIGKAIRSLFAYRVTYTNIKLQLLSNIIENSSLPAQKKQKVFEYDPVYRISRLEMKDDVKAYQDTR